MVMINSDLEAIEIIEGMQEPESEEQYIQAWQHLVNTGTVWHLQGSYGRTAMQLIENGIIKLNRNV
tara:strand:- start:384 stop:581 length:198 start_codon:yes stop_codon:yes gene_type:complete